MESDADMESEAAGVYISSECVTNQHFGKIMNLPW